jgi:prophage antirepressor-like protein
MDLLRSFVLEGTSHEVHMIWEDGEPLFKATDIGNVLGLGNIRSSLQSFRPCDKVVRSMDTPGGKQDATFLTEPAMYKLINRSRKPIAQKFQDWVAEVITSIRKTGAYKLDTLHQCFAKMNPPYCRSA